MGMVNIENLSIIKNSNMKLILILILSLFCNNRICLSIDYDSIRTMAIDFSDKMINNPNDILILLKSEGNVKTELLFKNKNFEKEIKKYQKLLSIQKSGNYKIKESYYTKYNGVDSSRLVIVYKKAHSILYDIFVGWYTSDCNDTIAHLYEIRDAELYFYYIQICQHTEISDLE